MFVQKVSGITNKWALPKLDSRQLVVLALLMGLDLVLGKLTIGTNVIKVGFVFIAISLIAKWYGPLWTMLIALVLDVVNITIVNPTGVFFIGFTVSAVFSALVYALGYYQQDYVGWLRIILVVGVITLVVNIFLNTVWLFIMYSHLHNMTTFMTLLGPRFVKSVIVFPIQVLITYAVLNNGAVKQATKKIFMS